MKRNYSLKGKANRRREQALAMLTFRLQADNTLDKKAKVRMEQEINILKNRIIGNHV